MPGLSFRKDSAMMTLKGADPVRKKCIHCTAGSMNLPHTIIHCVAVGQTGDQY